MLHHVSVGVADVQQAAQQFYDSVLSALGYKRVMEVLPYTIGYGDSVPEFWIGLPHDQNPASAGNGVHIGFKAKTKELVAAFHRAALAAGGTDEGEAGPRPDYGPDYFGAFVRDPYGNKLEAVLTPDVQAAAKQAPARAKAKRKTVKTGAKAKSRPPSKSSKVAKSGKTAKSGKAAKSRKAAKTGKAAKNSKVAKTGKAAKNGKAGNAGKSSKASKPASKKAKTSAKIAKRRR